MFYIRSKYIDFCQKKLASGGFGLRYTMYISRPKSKSHDIKCNNILLWIDRRL